MGEFPFSFKYFHTNILCLDKASFTRCIIMQFTFIYSVKLHWYDMIHYLMFGGLMLKIMSHTLKKENKNCVKQLQVKVRISYLDFEAFIRYPSLVTITFSPPPLQIRKVLRKVIVIKTEQSMFLKEKTPLPAAWVVSGKERQQKG